MTGQVTLSQVAAAAGVSVATASRALNGAPGRTVRPELAARVAAAAADLGYSVNAQAQATARGRTSTVGLVVHDIADPYAAAIASGVLAAAAGAGLLVTIVSTQSDPGMEVRHLLALQQQRVRAVILAGSRFTDEGTTRAVARITAAIRSSGGRIVAIGQDLLGVDTLRIDNTDAAQRLAEALCTLGYRRFAILGGPERLVTSEDRIAGYRAGLAAAGLPLPAAQMVSAPLTRDGGYVAMTELLAQDVEPDAVLAVSDVMAMGAMAALREHGYRIPTDVAVAGFDDIATLRDISPPLTTVRLPLEELGRRALEITLLASDGGPRMVEPVRGEVVVRESSPPRSR